MDNDWINAQIGSLGLLMFFWFMGVWGWAGTDYNYVSLLAPVCWTVLWGLGEEVKMASRVHRWDWEEAQRDLLAMQGAIEDLSRFVEDMMRQGKVTVQFVPVDDDDDDDEILQ